MDSRQRKGQTGRVCCFSSSVVGGERNEDGQRLEIKKDRLEMKDEVAEKHRKSKRGNSR